MTVIRHPNNQGVTLQQWRKTAAGGETSLSGTDDFSAGLAYTVGAEQVFVNGVLIERGVDYAATTGTTITGLTALVAGDIVTVSSPSAFNVANAIPLSQFTAKGDILVGTGASAETKLSVGSDGTTLVANSASATGVAWAGPTFTAGKNAIINGDFGVWQRGTTLTANGYLADRFYNDSDATLTQSQQTFTAGTAPVAGYEGTYFLRLAKSAGGSYCNASQRIENVRTFAGQTITLSFWAKVNTGTISYQADIVQNFGSGGSSAIDTYSSSVTITTSWARYSVTVSVPSVSGKTIGSGNYLGIYFGRFSGSGAITMDFWGVQVEAGSVATPFTTATGTLQGELAACQRYYYRLGGAATYETFAQVLWTSTTAGNGFIKTAQTLRTNNPSVEFASLRALVYSTAGVAVNSVSNVTLTQNANGNFFNLSVTAGGSMVTGFTGWIDSNGTTAGYLALSSEL